MSVFDGHGREGERVSHFLRQVLLSEVATACAGTEGDVVKALERAFRATAAKLAAFKPPISLKYVAHAANMWAVVAHNFLAG